jgi:hypothetical protein
MREIEYTARFRRDYKREKAGRHGKKLDTLLMEVVYQLAENLRCRPGISIIRCRANGEIIATATSGRTWF